MKLKNLIIYLLMAISPFLFSSSRAKSENISQREHKISHNLQKDNVLVFFSDDMIRNYNAIFQTDFLANEEYFKRLGLMFVNTYFHSMDSMEIYEQLIETEPYTPEREDILNKYIYDYPWNNYGIDKEDNIECRVLYETESCTIPEEITSYEGKIDVLFFMAHMNRNAILVNETTYLDISDIEFLKQNYPHIARKLSKDASIMFYGCSFAFEYYLPDMTGAEAMSEFLHRPVHASESPIGGALNTDVWEKSAFGVFKEIENLK